MLREVASSFKDDAERFYPFSTTGVVLCGKLCDMIGISAGMRGPVSPMLIQALVEGPVPPSDLVRLILTRAREEAKRIQRRRATIVAKTKTKKSEGKSKSKTSTKNKTKTNAEVVVDATAATAAGVLCDGSKGEVKEKDAHDERNGGGSGDSGVCSGGDVGCGLRGATPHNGTPPPPPPPPVEEEDEEEEEEEEEEEHRSRLAILGSHSGFHYGFHTLYSLVLVDFHITFLDERRSYMESQPVMQVRIERDKEQRAKREDKHDAIAVVVCTC